MLSPLALLLFLGVELSLSGPLRPAKPHASRLLLALWLRAIEGRKFAASKPEAAATSRRPQISRSVQPQPSLPPSFPLHHHISSPFTAATACQSFLLQRRHPRWRGMAKATMSTRCQARAIENRHQRPRLRQHLPTSCPHSRQPSTRPLIGTSCRSRDRQQPHDPLPTRPRTSMHHQAPLLSPRHTSS